MVDLGESANTSKAQFDAKAGEYAFVVSISDPYLETCVDTVFVSIYIYNSVIQLILSLI